MNRFRWSSLLYIILGAICIVYYFYFIKDIYYRPNLEYYYLYCNIYSLVAVPFLFFSITAFATLIIRDTFSIKISKSNKIFKVVSVILILIYVVFLIFTFISKEILIFNVISIYNMLFIVFGLIFSLGAHKDNKNNNTNI